MFRAIHKIVDPISLAAEVENFGYTVVDLPEPKSDDEARSWLNQLEPWLGRGISHKHAIDGVVSLTNNPALYRDNVIRPQSDTGHQAPHTDGAFELQPPQLMSVLCLQSADEGGETLIVDMGDAAKVLDESALRGLYVADAIAVIRGNQQAMHPVFSANGRGGTVARFSNHEYNVSYPNQTAAEPGFTAIDQYIKDPNNQRVINLRPGQLIVIDNERVLHGREEFSSLLPRHLLRKWYDGKEESGRTIVNTGIKSLLVHN